MKKSLFSILCSIISIIIIFLIFSAVFEASQETKVFNGYLNKYSMRLEVNDNIRFADIIDNVNTIPSVNNYIIYDMTANIQSGSDNIGVYVFGKVDHPALESGNYISAGDSYYAVVGNMYQNDKSITVDNKKYTVIGVLKKTNSYIDTNKYYTVNPDTACRGKILNIDSSSKNNVEQIYTKLSAEYDLEIIEVDYSDWNGYFNINKLTAALLIFAVFFIVISNALRFYFEYRLTSRPIDVYCLLGLSIKEILTKMMCKTILIEIAALAFVSVVGLISGFVKINAVLCGSLAYITFIMFYRTSMILIKLRGYK